MFVTRYSSHSYPWRHAQGNRGCQTHTYPGPSVCAYLSTVAIAGACFGLQLSQPLWRAVDLKCWNWTSICTRWWTGVRVLHVMDRLMWCIICLLGWTDAFWRSFVLCRSQWRVYILSANSRGPASARSWCLHVRRMQSMSDRLCWTPNLWISNIAPK